MEKSSHGKLVWKRKGDKKVILNRYVTKKRVSAVESFRIAWGKVYVCDVNMLHISTGKIDYAYNVGFYRLCKKYSKTINEIRTTCSAHSKTVVVFRSLSLIKYEIVTFS